MLNSSVSFNVDAKEQIRARINIADVIGRYVNLKQAGQNLKALCPFHKEKTPSFIVNPDKGIFHCFGCGKGGDVFTFLMEIEGLDFTDALKMLAEETGVSLRNHSPAIEAGRREPAFPSKAILYEIHVIAMKYFYECLKKNINAQQYFKARHIQAQTAREFFLGYAPDGWTDFIEFAKAKGFSTESLIACGLAIPKTESDFSQAYDRFRDRIIFPIFDMSGRPIAFAGRSLKQDAAPKYLNSPQTPLYNKNRILYGLHKARGHIKKKEDKIIVVEGYMDYLALYQAGICNVVATCGTALSLEHGHLLQRFSQHVYLVFDGDEAGIVAAKRAVFTLVPLGLDIRVLVLPDKDDPDSFIAKNGPEKFIALLNKADNYSDFIIEITIKEKKAESAHEKSSVVESLIPLIGSIPNSIVREDVIRKLAQRLKISEKHIYSAVQKRRLQPQVETQKTTTSFADHLKSYERNFFSLLLQNSELIETAQKYIGPETFTDPSFAELYSKMLNIYKQNRTWSAFIDTLESAEEKSFVSSLMVGQIQRENAYDELLHTIVQLQKKYLKYRIREITQRLAAEPQERFNLLKEHKYLTSQLKELEKKQ